MAKKYIDVMDTTFRDGFQSVFGGRVLMDDFLPAVEFASSIGINHFEFGGGARFQSLFFYLQENAFDMMQRFRVAAGAEANLQVLARGINTVMLDTASEEMIKLFVKLFAKYETTTVRNFDALNDMRNLQISADEIVNNGMMHEVTVTLMDLPPGCTGAHDVKFYRDKVIEILDLGIPFDSIVFKDASGTSNPAKIYQVIRMARELLGDETHIRLHTHETAGISVAAYLAALEAGVDGIDLAISPVSGGTSQPDMLTMLHATKTMGYNLGDLELSKVLEYERFLKNQLKDYFIPPEATAVNPLIPFAPMPGGALTANTQMMRDSGNLDKFDEVIEAMTEVVQKGGYGTSVTPVSQFYWQQAYANVMFGKWEKITKGYGKMVLGYFGKTPVVPDPKIVELASKQLNLEPTFKNPVEIANEDKTKSIAYWKEILEKEGIEASEENIFIAAACKDKGIAFLKGESPLMVRKKEEQAKIKKEEITKSDKKPQEYTVVVNGKSYSVQVAKGTQAIESIKEVSPESSNSSKTTSGSIKVTSQTSGQVFKIVKSVGDSVEAGETIMILEAMKMEVEVAPLESGVIKSIEVSEGSSVVDGQILATLE